jgi:hypothetical protein
LGSLDQFVTAANKNEDNYAALLPIPSPSSHAVISHPGAAVAEVSTLLILSEKSSTG